MLACFEPFESDWNDGLRYVIFLLSPQTVPPSILKQSFLPERTGLLPIFSNVLFTRRTLNEYFFNAIDLISPSEIMIWSSASIPSQAEDFKSSIPPVALNESQRMPSPFERIVSLPLSRLTLLYEKIPFAEPLVFARLLVLSCAAVVRLMLTFLIVRPFVEQMQLLAFFEPPEILTEPLPLIVSFDSL